MPRGNRRGREGLAGRAVRGRRRRGGKHRERPAGADQPLELLAASPVVLVGGASVASRLAEKPVQRDKGIRPAGSRARLGLFRARAAAVGLRWAGQDGLGHTDQWN